MCDLGRLVLGPLKAFWGVLQICRAPDAEEKRKSASRSLLAGGVLT